MPLKIQFGKVVMGGALNRDEFVGVFNIRLLTAAATYIKGF